MLYFSGRLHAGVGETHINNILAAINISVIHHKTLKRREREAGKGLESLTKRTVKGQMNQNFDTFCLAF